jgi:hypothetical protein
MRDVFKSRQSWAHLLFVFSNELKRRIFMKGMGIFSEELLFDWLIDWLDRARLSAECKTRLECLDLIVDSFGEWTWANENESRPKNADWRLMTDQSALDITQLYCEHCETNLRFTYFRLETHWIRQNSKACPIIAHGIFHQSPTCRIPFSPGISPYKSWFSGPARFGQFLVVLWMFGTL